MPLFDSPRVRRLKSDHEALKALKAQSTIVDFQAFGDPPERYLITFKGKGLVRKGEQDPVQSADVHRAEIRLGIDYPRSRPDLQWLTSIYHPNISAVGAVCLGGYSTNWVPSLGLADLVTMLWDMVRYANYDPKSAYNYAAGRWCETQTQFEFPLDPRPLRDRVGRTVGDNVISFKATAEGKAPPPAPAPGPSPAPAPPPRQEEDVLVINDDSPEPPPPPPRRPSGDEDILIIE